MFLTSQWRTAPITYGLRQTFRLPHVYQAKTEIADQELGGPILATGSSKLKPQWLMLRITDFTASGHPSGWHRFISVKRADQRRTNKKGHPRITRVACFNCRFALSLRQHLPSCGNDVGNRSIQPVRGTLTQPMRVPERQRYDPQSQSNPHETPYHLVR